jgi:hypothetical protein
MRSRQPFPSSSASPGPIYCYFFVKLGYNAIKSMQEPPFLYDTFVGYIVR